jgi:hypothetical protein
MQDPNALGNEDESNAAPADVPGSTVEPDAAPLAPAAATAPVAPHAPEPAAETPIHVVDETVDTPAEPATTAEGGAEEALRPETAPAHIEPDQPAPEPPPVATDAVVPAVAADEAAASPRPHARGVWTDEQVDAVRARLRDATATFVDKAAGAVMETVNVVASAIRSRTSPDQRRDRRR